tara:strand:+ start:634 stop:2070 length:1437 start_codon:yes stop_codon:yes gene_type:complete
MKVLVLNPPTDNEGSIVRDMLFNCWCWGKRIANAESPPINSLYVATVLKESYFNVDFIDADAIYKSKKDFVNSLKQNYDFLVFSTSSMTFQEDIITLRMIKEKMPDIKTIIFGSHPTFYSEKILRIPEVDFIVFGEAEYPIRDIIFNKNLEEIKSIGFKKNGELRINRERYDVPNLDELPFPDWTMLSKDLVYFHPLIEQMPWTTAVSSRGCSGECNFCISPSLFGKYRQRSVQNVVEEMEYLVNLGFKEVFYRDETFTVNKKRTLGICKAVKESDWDISWICNSRVDTIDREMMLALHQAGCHTIKFGVESGNQKILDNIQKGTTLKQARDAFKIAREIGIKTHAHSMLGCIGETKETLRDTINFAKEIKPTTVTFNVFTPFSGTPVYDLVINELEKKDVDGTEIDISIEHAQAYYNDLFTELTNEDVTKSLRQAYKEFYLRPSYFFDRIKMINSFDRLKKDIKSGVAVSSFIFNLQ